MLPNLFLEWGLNAIKRSFISPYSCFSTLFPYSSILIKSLAANLVHVYAALDNIAKKCLKVFINNNDIIVTITKFGIRKEGKNGVSINP